jgi:hypothetical protein
LGTAKRLCDAAGAVGELNMKQDVYRKLLAELDSVRSITLRRPRESAGFLPKPRGSVSRRRLRSRKIFACSGPQNIAAS